MSNTYIYMNEQIRYKKPRRPVIVVKQGRKQTEGNEFDLTVGSKLVGKVVYDPKGLKAVKTHAVKAWIELYE